MEAETVNSPEVRWLRPAVDVLESEQALMLVVDLPGVGTEALGLELEGKELKLEAPRADGTGYRRNLKLPDDVDGDGIEATLSDGVLRLVLPRRVETLRRRIEVS